MLDQLFYKKVQEAKEIWAKGYLREITWTYYHNYVQQQVDEHIAEKYVECSECGVLVNREKLIPTAELKEGGRVYASVVYFCKHCKK